MTRQLRVIEPKSVVSDMEGDLRGALDLARAITLMAEGMPEHIGGPTIQVAWAIVDKLETSLEMGEAF